MWRLVYIPLAFPTHDHWIIQNTDTCCEHVILSTNKDVEVLNKDVEVLNKDVEVLNKDVEV